MKLVDANVLLYVVNRDEHHHTEALRWLNRALSEVETIGFAWLSLTAFLRVSTRAGVFPRPLEVDKAVGVVRGWLAQGPALVIEPTVRHLDVLAGLLANVGTAGNLVNDAHLAALALEHDATVVSYDSDFGRFEGVRWSRPSTA